MACNNEFVLFRDFLTCKDVEMEDVHCQAKREPLVDPMGDIVDKHQWTRSNLMKKLQKDFNGGRKLMNKVGNPDWQEGILKKYKIPGFGEDSDSDHQSRSVTEPDKYAPSKYDSDYVGFPHCSSSSSSEEAMDDTREDVGVTDRTIFREERTLVVTKRPDPPQCKPRSKNQFVRYPPEKKKDKVMSEKVMQTKRKRVTVLVVRGGK